MFALALTTMAVPVATLNYDGRFGIPAHGLVAASGALGAAGLADAVRGLARSRTRRARAAARGRPAYSR